MTGKELKEWRKKRGLSQAALALKLGVIRETVARWEVGIRTIPPLLHWALRGLETELKEEKPVTKPIVEGLETEKEANDGGLS